VAQVTKPCSSPVVSLRTHPMSHTKLFAFVFLLASAVVQANQCPRDGECPAAALQNGVSLLQTKLQTNVQSRTHPSHKNSMALSRIQDFCSQPTIKSTSKPQWYSCRVLNSTCQTGASLSNPPSLVLWQIMHAAQAEPNELQLGNAVFLPDNAEIRWLDDGTMTSSLIHKISHHLESVTGSNKLCESFMLLRPGASRANVFRTAVLWRYGGMYLDHKLMLVEDLHNWIDLSKSNYATAPKNNMPEGVWNAVLYASRPYLSLTLCWIEHQIENVGNRAYFSDRDPFVWDKQHDIGNYLKTTGPSALYDAWQEYLDGKCGALHNTSMDMQLDRYGCPKPPAMLDGVKVDMCLKMTDGRATVWQNVMWHAQGQAESAYYGDLYMGHMLYCDEVFDPSKLPDNKYDEHVRNRDPCLDLL